MLCPSAKWYENNKNVRFSDIDVTPQDAQFTPTARGDRCVVERVRAQVVKVRWVWFGLACSLTLSYRAVLFQKPLSSNTPFMTRDDILFSRVWYTLSQTCAHNTLLKMNTPQTWVSLFIKHYFNSKIIEKWNLFTKWERLSKAALCDTRLEGLSNVAPANPLVFCDSWRREHMSAKLTLLCKGTRFFFCFSQNRQPHTRDQRPKKSSRAQS